MLETTVAPSGSVTGYQLASETFHCDAEDL